MSEREYKSVQDLPEHLQYPIDKECVDERTGKKAKPVHNEVLAAEMATVFDGYVEYAKIGESRGLTDVQAAIFQVAHQAMNRTEQEYYQRFGTTKKEAMSGHTAAMKMIKHNQQIAEAKQHLVGESYQQSLHALNDLRAAVQVFDSTQPDEKGSQATHINSSSPLRLFVEAHEQIRQASDSQETPLSKRYRSKVEQTLNKLYKSARIRRAIARDESIDTTIPTATDCIYGLYPSVTTEVRRLLDFLETMLSTETLDTAGAHRVFGQYDLASYSFDQFTGIAPAIESDGSNIVELAHTLQKPSEKYSTMLATHEERDRRAETLREEHRQRQEALQRETRRVKDLAKAQDELQKLTERIAALQSGVV